MNLSDGENTSSPIGRERNTVREQTFREGREFTAREVDGHVNAFDRRTTTAHATEMTRAERMTPVTVLALYRWRVPSGDRQRQTSLQRNNSSNE